MQFRAPRISRAPTQLGNMWQFKRDFEAAYCERRALDRARALHPGIANFCRLACG